MKHNGKIEGNAVAPGAASRPEGAELRPKKGSASVPYGESDDPAAANDARNGENSGASASDGARNGENSGASASDGATGEGTSFQDREAVLVVENLKKRYGKNPNYAVDGVSFTIRPGEIVGLVGTNGAGKSTTIKCITGYLPFDEGRISIAGADVGEDPVGAKRNFGYVPDDRAVFEKMSGMEYLSFVADVRRVGRAERAERIAEFQERFKLGDKIFRPIYSYSHGMRQKICLMASLIHRPKLWILDEPMTGLDPQTTKSLKDTMADYGKAGNAVLFSSHNLEIVEKISDRVVMIRKGLKLADGTIGELRAANGGVSFEALFLELYGDEA